MKGSLRPEPFRIFVAFPSPAGCCQVLQPVEAPPGVEEAYEIMLADNVPAQTAANMAAGWAHGGKDPVACAVHYVKVRREFRADRARWES